MRLTLRLDPAALSWRVGGLALGISLCLWWLSPSALPYLGLSGVLYGLFVLGLAPQALQRDGYALVALVVITAWCCGNGMPDRCRPRTI